jgi:GMP synthase (glutamine-hydrolysing)
MRVVTMPPIRLLILDNSVDPDLYGPVHQWARHLPPGTAVDAFRTVEGALPAEVAGYTHCIVTGSEASINGDAAWIEGAGEVLRDAVGEGIPVLTSCFGHQLAVRALSGRRHVRASPTPEFGWVEVAWDRAAQAGDPVASALPSPALCYSAHFDEVFDLPPDWATLASTPRCPHAVIRWRRGPVWGFQHHPEIEPPEGRALYDAFVQRVDDRRRAVMEAAFCPEVRDSMLTPALVRAFLAVPRA